MKTLKSLVELREAGLNQNLLETLIPVMSCYISGGKYDSEKDGYLVLVETIDRKETILQEIGVKTFADILWEGMRREDHAKCYIGVVLRNNQFAITVVAQECIKCKALLNCMKKELE